MPQEMYVFDPERKVRFWHRVDMSAGTRDYVFAMCGKIFDVRPKGVDMRGSVESEDVICSICLMK